MRTCIAAATLALITLAPDAMAESVRAPDGLAHVEKMGDGPVDLVLIPGLASDWTVWRAFMERNADRYTMYAVTLPGFGGSEADIPENPRGTPLLDSAIDAINELATMHELDEPFVMGHSMGGHLALRIGLEHPDPFAGVINVDGFVVAPVQTEMTADQRRAFVENQFAPQIRAAGGAMWMQQFAASADSMVQDKDRAQEILAMMRASDGDAIAQYVIEMFMIDMRPDLPDLAVPTLVLAATPDMPGVSVGPEFWEETTEGAKNLELIFIERSRHFIMDDAPEALDERVGAFVGKHD
jgi:pimeloyl-ACP methyl ester carboxylesterase